MCYLVPGVLLTLGSDFPVQQRIQCRLVLLCSCSLDEQDFTCRQQVINICTQIPYIGIHTTALTCRNTAHIRSTLEDRMWLPNDVEGD